MRELKKRRGEKIERHEPVRDIRGKVLLQRYTTALDPISFSRLGQDMRAFISVWVSLLLVNDASKCIFQQKWAYPPLWTDGDRRNRWKDYGFV